MSILSSDHLCRFPSIGSFEAGTSKIASLPPAKPVAVAVAETMTAAPESPVLPVSRHILLEGYLLIKDKTRPPRVPSNEEIKLICEMFHETYEVSVNVSYLIIRCHKLPKKPWPLTIGGMPLWITSDATETPEIESRGGRAPPIMEHLPFSTIASPTGQHFNSIAQYFLNSLDVTVSEIMWNGIQLRLTIPDDVRPEKLPFKIGKLLAVYNKTNAIPEHREAARRLIIPPATVRDDTCYFPNLRPGVMLSCGCNGEEELCTSSGIIVENSAGDKWLTVASHGFPLGNETVYHPGANGPVVGTVEKIFGDTDISLAKLQKEICYSAQTFGSDLKPSIELKSLRGSAGLLIGDYLTMENSFSGLCEGIFMASIWKRIPADENPHQLPWVVISNFYLGNGGEESFDGSCGSPVFTETGEVVGLFRFMTNNGKAYCVSAEVLMETGYKLSNIGEE